LGAAAQRVWRLVDIFEFDERELVILTAAARQADDIALLERLIRRDGPVVPGSMGQPRLSGALTEVRQGRLALAKLLAELALPADEEDAGLSPNQKRAQTAARARWDRVERQKERDRARVVDLYGSPDTH
jgi:hypothetical protein